MRWSRKLLGAGPGQEIRDEETFLKIQFYFASVCHRHKVHQAVEEIISLSLFLKIIVT